jgi:hypothetical protein
MKRKISGIALAAAAAGALVVGPVVATASAATPVGGTVAVSHTTIQQDHGWRCHGWDHWRRCHHWDRW